MRYFNIPGTYTTKPNIFGPRQNEAIALNRHEWGNIMYRLHRNEIVQEEQRKKREYEESKRDRSKAMTSTWDNVVGGDQVERERKAELERLEREKLEEYEQIKIDRKARRDAIVEAARKRIFTRRTECETLLHAFRRSWVFADQEEQKKYNLIVRNPPPDYEALKRFKEDGQKVIQEAADYKKSCKQKRDAYGVFLRGEIAKNEERRRKEHDEQIRAEIQDLENMKMELDSLADYELRRRKLECVDYSSSIKVNRNIENIMSLEDKEEEKINKYFEDHKWNLRKARMKFEKEEILQTIEDRANILKATREEDHSEEILLRNMEAARLEKERIALKEIEMKEAKRQALIEDRKIEREKSLKAAAQKKREREQTIKWEVMQMKAADDHDAAWRIEHNKKLRQIKLDYRKILDAQVKENMEKLEAERIANIPFSMRKSDEAYLAYAAEILQETKDRGWNTIPVERAILNFKKETQYKEEEEDSNKDKHDSKNCKKSEK